MDHHHSPHRSVGEAVLTFADAAVVQLVSGDPRSPSAAVAPLHSATVTITSTEIAATDGDFAWAWPLAELHDAVHARRDTWTILMIPGIDDFGVQLAEGDVDHFRRFVDRHLGRVGGESVVAPDASQAAPPTPVPPAADPSRWSQPSPWNEPARSGLPAQSDTPARSNGSAPEPAGSGPVSSGPVSSGPASSDPASSDPASSGPASSGPVSSDPARMVTTELPVTSATRTSTTPDAHHVAVDGDVRSATVPRNGDVAAGLAGLDARTISAWFGSHLVLDRVSLEMPAGQVTALIGPSGCGKSTFLRILNRMHEMIPSAKMAGEVILDGQDVYDPNRKLTDARREIGMVFQKPNPFPAMSIYDNTIASLRLTGKRASQADKDAIVESCLMKAGLWNEVKDRLRQPGGGLSGGQQQRLCIARALAIRPRVLLMDEPCSALDPTSTRRIEQTIMELVADLTIVIVTHNMQQAARVSDRCAFFLAEQGTPGHIVEHGPTTTMFGSPQDQRTNDYVNGRFG